MKGIIKNRSGTRSNIFFPFVILPVSAAVLCIIIYSFNHQNEQPAAKHSETRLFFDTYCTITLYGTDEDNLAELTDELFRRCGEYEALLSISVETSDIWRVNHAGGSEVTVSGATAAVIEKALLFGQISGGLFDVTIGRLSRLWGFGSADGSHGIPGTDEISKTLQSVDYRQVSINAGMNTVLLQNPETWLDLGGIAKGYIADELAMLLTLRGIDSALIDLGGDITALGSKPGEEPWKLAVRRPFGSMDDYIGVLEISNAAVVSSGIYERMFEENGILYHHILDPETGYPADSDIIAATVIAKDAVTGEGLSTIAIIAGSGQIQEIFEKTPGFIGAVLVLDNYDVVTLGEVAWSYRQ